MNERHKGQLKLAHQLYDNRDLKQELLYQREFLDTGYLNYQQVCFNKWIFDKCLKLLEERKKGKWEFIGDNCFKCSECGEVYTVDQFNHINNYCNNRFPKACPNCATEMESE